MALIHPVLSLSPEFCDMRFEGEPESCGSCDRPIVGAIVALSMIEEGSELPPRTTLRCASLRLK